VLSVLANCWVLVLPEPGNCQETATPSISASENDDDEELSEKERETRITAGLAAVAGIATVGIGLIAVTLIWGARLRRQNRMGLPTAPPPAENWFLKRPRSDSPKAAPTDKDE
jgi:hypothetical protein